MVESQWRRRVGPGLLTIAVLGLLGAGQAGADERTWTPQECRAGPDPVSLRTIAPVPSGEPGPAPWYRLDPALDDQLIVEGQRLTIGATGSDSGRSLALDPESFAAGPFGGLILAGTDDGRASSLRLIDPGAACGWTLATSSDVIRRATIDPAMTAIYEYRVERETRNDLGVWRRELGRSAAARRVLPPLEASAHFGTTFSTELSWTADGDQLVVQSCGELACRTRLLDPVAGTVAIVDQPDLGEVVGVIGDRMISYGACRGLPCPLTGIYLSSGDRTLLSEDSGVAVLVQTAGGPRIVHEVGAGVRPVLRVLEPTGEETSRLVPPEDGLSLVPAPSRAGAGIGLAAGWIALARDGGVAGGPDTFAVLRHLETGRIVPIEEFTR